MMSIHGITKIEARPFNYKDEVGWIKIRFYDGSRDSIELTLFFDNPGELHAFVAALEPFTPEPRLKLEEPEPVDDEIPF